MIQRDILESIRNGEGYRLDFRMQQAELYRIRDLIKIHLVNKISDIDPELAKQFEQMPLEKYHELSHLINHTEVMKRVNRIMPLAFVSELRKTSLLSQLKATFGGFVISDEEMVGRESVSLRFVRPNSPNDVGSLHCDDWFWEIYNFPKPINTERIKVWIAICCETGKSGLYISPNSQKRTWQYSVENKNGMLKPVLDVSSEKPEVVLCETQPGEAVVFNYDSLHGGAVSRGLSTRVSLEFTMLVANRSKPV